MHKSITIKFIATLYAVAAVNPVFAHDGHGLSGTHWHPTDVWGFVALGGAIAVALWLSRGGK